MLPSCGEPLLFSLDENNNFVITGIGQDVGGIEFKADDPIRLIVGFGDNLPNGSGLAIVRITRERLLGQGDCPAGSEQIPQAPRFAQ